MSYSNVIAIDGPCGSGKSAIAKMLASNLSVLYVDTGAMFRAIGYWLKKQKINFDDAPQHLARLELYYGRSLESLVEINGENLTEIIREHHVSELASQVSKVSEVRAFLLEFQRKLATKRVCVMEGRDIGTVVFPDAFCKIFLTASVDVRTKRRLGQLQEKGNNVVTYQQVYKDIEERDQNDMNRKLAPLKQASDAYLLDSSELTIDQVIDKMNELVRSKASKVDIKL